MVVLDPELETLTRNQRTICRPVDYSGIGIHSGKKVTIRLCPAEPGSGVVFQRTDLPGEPVIKASVENVVDTTRSTTIGAAGVFVSTVEHVLAAVKAYGIDNLLIQVSDKEPPIDDGSSRLFVEMIEEGGIQEIDQTTPIIKIKNPVYWSRGGTHLAALPYEGFRVSYTLHYPDDKALQNQFFSSMVDPQNFKNEIAPCRTFSRYAELEYLIDRGLIKGGSMANTLVVKDDVVFSKEGLHFKNEMARHKALDLIGDLSLVGYNLYTHVIGFRTGHEANVLFAQELLNSIMTEKQ